MFIQMPWDGFTCHLFDFSQVISSGAQTLSNIIGAGERREAAQAAADAARRAADRAKAFQDERLRIERELLAEGKELRAARNEASIRATALLEERGQAAPGTSRFFTEGLARGSEEIAEILAAQGLGPDTSVFGEFTGELGGRLLTAEEQTRLNINQFLAGQGIDPSGLGLQFGQQALAGEQLVQSALGAQTTAELAGATLPTTGQLTLQGLSQLLESRPEILGEISGLFTGRGGEGAGAGGLGFTPSQEPLGPQPGGFSLLPERGLFRFGENEPNDEDVARILRQVFRQ